LKKQEKRVPGPAVNYKVCHRILAEDCLRFAGATAAAALAYIVVLFVLTGSTHVSAGGGGGGAKIVTIETLADVDFGDWEDAGSITSDSSSYCITARDGNKKKDFKVSMSNAGSSSSTFDLYDLGGSGESIAIGFEAFLVKNGVTYQVTLSPGALNSQKGKEPCDNITLRTNIAESALTAATPGDYKGTFTLFAQIHNSSSHNDEEDFDVEVSVVAATQVQISGLSTIVFETDPTSSGELTADETFCIHSTVGDYSISTQSSVTSNGSFALQSVVGSEKLPIDVFFADNVTGASLQNAETGDVTGSGDSVSPNCSGVDNSMVRIVIADTDIRTSTSGDYAATLTLTVTPQ